MRLNSLASSLNIPYFIAVAWTTCFCRKSLQAFCLAVGTLNQIYFQTSQLSLHAEAGLARVPASSRACQHPPGSERINQTTWWVQDCDVMKVFGWGKPSLNARCIRAMQRLMTLNSRVPKIVINLGFLSPLGIWAAVLTISKSELKLFELLTTQTFVSFPCPFGFTWVLLLVILSPGLDCKMPRS